MLDEILTEESFKEFVNIALNSNETSVKDVLDKILKESDKEGVRMMACFVYGYNDHESDDAPPEVILQDSVIAGLNLIVSLENKKPKIDEFLERCKEDDVLLGGAYLIGKFYPFEGLRMLFHSIEARLSLNSLVRDISVN